MPPTESQNAEEELKSSDDTMKILIATDNHLGYKEKDDMIGEDSFIAFEEILDLAVENDVDFILLGGDLFHDAVPSQNTLYKCMRLLRRVTFGDKPISLEFLSDQSVNFMDALNQTVNYEDPNLNISIPIFSIHGNHDDPSGFASLSSLDILSTNGLINYFGKSTNPNQIIINPILLKKGETQLALYGLSHIRDARLARLFRDSKVIMETPPESTGTWFNLMVLHQNRVERGTTNYLPEHILPKFLDLIIWGHEHDCRIEPEPNQEQGFFISQPGSSVATSLSEGEALPKHCGILQIYKNQFVITKLPLKTVRPFVFKSINLGDYIEEYHLDDGGAEDKVMEIAMKIIEEMITEAEAKISGDPKQPTLPLIRLRIIYTDEQQMFNSIRFGQKYNQRIANPLDCVVFTKKKIINKGSGTNFDKSAMDDIMESENTEDDVKVEDIVDRYFDQCSDESKLQIFQSKILSEMCSNLADKNDVDAADKIINFYKERAIDHLMEKLPGEEEEEVQQEIINFRDGKANANYDAILNLLANRATKYIPDIDEDDFQIELEKTSKTKAKTVAPKIIEKETQPKPAARGRGRGRGGRGAATANTTATKRPELNVTIANKSAQQNTRTTQQAKQSSIMDSFSQIAERVQSTQNRQTKRLPAKSKIVYEISDDSD